MSLAAVAASLETRVAAIIACIGVIPHRTNNSSSRNVVSAIGDWSAPHAMRTPAARAALNAWTCTGPRWSERSLKFGGMGHRLVHSFSNWLSADFSVKNVTHNVGT